MAMTDQTRVPDYDQVWTQVYGDMQDIGPVHRHMKRIIRTLLRQIEYESVLDIGCGPGHNLSMLCKGRSLKRRVNGIDISNRAIEEARRTFSGEFYQLDIQKRRLEGSWDLVFSSLLLEHLPDDIAGLRHMRAMTGKYLLVSTIAGDFQRYKALDEQMGHVRNYQVGELEEKLVKAGFNLEKVIYWGFPFYTPLGRTLQNHISIGTGKFGFTSRFVAEIMYYLYFLNSYKRGDLLVVLASV
jgi:SAM-dependent methyltransferase